MGHLPLLCRESPLITAERNVPFAISALAQQTGTPAHNRRAACTRSSEYTDDNQKNAAHFGRRVKHYLKYIFVTGKEKADLSFSKKSA